MRALKTRHSADPLQLREALDRAYATAMRDLKKKYPDDLDAATLYAEALMDLRPWRLWNADGTPAEGTLEIVTGILGSSWRQAERTAFNPRQALRSLRFYEAVQVPGIQATAIPLEISDVRFRVDLSSVTPLEPAHLRSEPTLRGAMTPRISVDQLHRMLDALRQAPIT